MYSRVFWSWEFSLYPSQIEKNRTCALNPTSVLLFTTCAICNNYIVLQSCTFAVFLLMLLCASSSWRYRPAKKLRVQRISCVLSEEFANEWQPLRIPMPTCNAIAWSSIKRSRIWTLETVSKSLYVLDMPSQENPKPRLAESSELLKMEKINFPLWQDNRYRIDLPSVFGETMP